MSGPTRGPIRGILGLSVGTVIVRAMAALSQILLAFWLSPEQFGYWAAAMSSISLVAGLTNAGEVNGYLSGKGHDLRTTLRSTVRINLVLTVVACGIALTYLFTGNTFVALLAAIAAVTIPFSGAADVSNAASVKAGKYRYLVAVQTVAAIVRLAFGVLVAALTGSAIALAISALTYFLVIEVGLFRVVRAALRVETPIEKRMPVSTRISWAANSLALTIPLQIGFFVAQFVASPALLGVFYLAYQITVGVAGFVAGPLGRVTLAQLGSLSDKPRLATAIRLSGIFGGGMLVLVIMALWFAPFIQPLLSAEWQAAIPTTIILLASLPARMMGPVVDAYQQATGKWWQGTMFNVVDALGTAAAALFAISGDVLILATAMAAWKIVFALVRAGLVYRSAGVSTLAALMLPLTIASGIVVTLPSLPDAEIWILAALSLATAGWTVWQTWPWISRRRRSHG
ncbi:oligosaccharide flippase family protein [Microbacterium binotii]|uniref:O-antigen/teichoic acid export membrane protein n=1 Tax=Microbacterium binotii TaxID=462710 RepID=A0ABP6BRG4_9MICO